MVSSPARTAGGKSQASFYTTHDRLNELLIFISDFHLFYPQSSLSHKMSSSLSILSQEVHHKTIESTGVPMGIRKWSTSSSSLLTNLHQTITCLTPKIGDYSINAPLWPVFYIFSEREYKVDPSCRCVTESTLRRHPHFSSADCRDRQSRSSGVFNAWECIWDEGSS